MNYLFKSKPFLLICIVLQACSSAEKANIEKADEDKVTLTTTDQTKKKGIVLLDDNGKLGDLFKSGSDEIGSVNKYLWQASLEVLSFLPINSADPFSGIIVFSKGKAPGSSQSYDATVYVSDPALDARSLSVTVRSSNGTVSSEAKREIESAILSRARQLRLKELDL
ncbi:DUF3576 domain-containing protein [Amylibacter sp.]|nr:DUF3576 domain-containing protein [Amylibacter sp.]MDC1532796.1 DUF3576 domain-containing protein [Amylibacter sp.]